MAKFHVPEHMSYNNVLTMRKPTMAGDSPGELLSNARKKEALKKRMDLKKARNIPSISNTTSAQKAQVLNVGQDPSKFQAISSAYCPKDLNQETKSSSMNVIMESVERTDQVAANLLSANLGITETRQENCPETIPKSYTNVGIKKKIGLDGSGKKDNDHRGKQINKNFSIKTEKSSIRTLKTDNEGVLSSEVGHKKIFTLEKMHNKNIEILNKKSKDVEIHLKTTVNNSSNINKLGHTDPFNKKNLNTGLSSRINSQVDQHQNISKETDIVTDVSHFLPDENSHNRESVDVTIDKTKSILKHSGSKTDLQTTTDKVNGIKVNNDGKEYNQTALNSKNKEVKPVITKGNIKNPIKKTNLKYFNKNLNTKVFHSEEKSPVLESIERNKDPPANSNELSLKTKFEAQEGDQSSSSKNTLKVSTDQAQSHGDMSSFENSTIIHEEHIEKNIERKVSPVRNLQDSDIRGQNPCSDISDFPLILNKSGIKGKKNSKEYNQPEKVGKELPTEESKETEKSLEDEILQIKLALESLPIDQLGFLEDLDRELLRKDGNKKSAKKKKSGTSAKKTKHARSCSEKLGSLYDSIIKDNTGKDDTVLHDRNYKDNCLLWNPHEHKKKRSIFGKVVKSYVSVNSFFLRKHKKNTSCRNLRKSVSVGLLQGLPFKLNKRKDIYPSSHGGSKKLIKLRSDSKYLVDMNRKSNKSLSTLPRNLTVKPFLDGEKVSLQEMDVFPTCATDSNRLQASSPESNDQTKKELHEKIFAELFEVLKNEKHKSSSPNYENNVKVDRDRSTLKNADFKKTDKAPNFSDLNGRYESIINKENSQGGDSKEYGSLSKQTPEFYNQDYIDVLMRLSFSIASAITSVSTNLNKVQPMSRNDIYYYIRSYIEKTRKCDNFQELEEKGIVRSIYNEIIDSCQKNAFPDNANSGVLKQIVEDVVNSNTETISSMQNRASSAKNDRLKVAEPYGSDIIGSQTKTTKQDEKANSVTDTESKNNVINECEPMELKTGTAPTLGHSKLGQGKTNAGDISQHELRHGSGDSMTIEVLKIPGNESKVSNREEEIASSAETIGSIGVCSKHKSGSDITKVRTKRNTETSSNTVQPCNSNLFRSEETAANSNLENEGNQISEMMVQVLEKPNDAETMNGRSGSISKESTEPEEEINSTTSSEDQIKENTMNESLNVNGSANEVLERHKRKTGETTVKPNRKLIASKVKKKESSRRSAMENISRELSRIIGKSLSESRLDVYGVAEQIKNAEMQNGSLKAKEHPSHMKKTSHGSQLNKKKRKHDRKQKDESSDKSDKPAIDSKKGNHASPDEKKESKKLAVSSNTTLNTHLQNIYNAIVFGDGNYSSTVSSAKYLSNYLRKASKGSKETLFHHWAKLCHSGQLTNKKVLIERANQKSPKKSFWTVIRETTNLILYNKK